MASEQDAGFSIRLGFWTNWSKGQVLGATITMDRFQANILIAITSFFLGFVGTRFWRILCLILHRWYSKPFHPEQDALHHQRQVILRNSQTPESGLQSLSRLYWAWRGSSDKPLSKMLPSILIALFTFAGFVAVGAFSAAISSSAGREVLLDSTHCGILSIGMAATDTWSTEVANDAAKAAKDASYASQCYSSQNSGASDCSTYVTPRLPTTMNLNASCPFDDKLCRSKDNNLILDSGYIDSLEHLGLNAPESDRIQIRQLYHCAPLVSEGYSSTVEHEGIEYTRLHYGKGNWGSWNNITSYNFSHQVESLSAQYPPRPAPDVWRTNNFILSTAGVWAWEGEVWDNSDFIPIPELERLDSDLFIFYLSGNGVSFSQPTMDPWYQATTKGPFIEVLDNDGGKYFYTPDQAASAIGCVNQYQICRGKAPKNEAEEKARCGPLSNFFDARVGAEPLFGVTPDMEVQSNELPDDATRAVNVFSWFMTVWEWMVGDQFYMVNVLGTAVLESQRKLRGGLQAPLPDDQWKIDMTYLWNTTLASLQAGYASAPQGNTKPELQDMLRKPANPTQHGMCANQKILSSRFGSFSFFGLCFTYGLGLLLVGASYSIECSLSRQLARNYRKSPQSTRTYNMAFKFLEWNTNETLQQHRMAQEELGWGDSTWKECDQYVPITEKGVPLGSLDIRDLKHPVLHVPRGGGGMVEQKTNFTHCSHGSWGGSTQFTRQESLQVLSPCGSSEASDRRSTLDRTQSLGPRSPGIYSNPASPTDSTDGLNPKPAKVVWQEPISPSNSLTGNAGVGSKRSQSTRQEPTRSCNAEDIQRVDTRTSS